MIKPDTLIDRLRGICPGAVSQYKPSPINVEAADEIERLRAKIAQLGRMNSAPDFLKAAIRTQEERGKEYDKPEGERSMSAVVVAFNAITGQSITEAQGWLLMEILKNVRLFTAPGFHCDSAIDGVSYASLKAEAKAREESHASK